MQHISETEKLFLVRKESLLPKLALIQVFVTRLVIGRYHMGGRRYEENARGSLYGIWSFRKYRQNVESLFVTSCIMQKDSGDLILVQHYEESI